MKPSTKKTQLVLFYFVYRPKENAPRTDITNDDKKVYAFVPTYGDGSTAFNHHIIYFIQYDLMIVFR